MGYYGRRQNKQDKSVFWMGLLLLCALAAIGYLTHTLFKKNGNDGTIGVNVTTGKVQVDIIDEDKKSLVGNVLDFVTDDGEKAYFEPGATFYTEGFNVKNTGNIPIDFRVSLSKDEDIDFEKFQQAFDFYIVDDPENTDEMEKLTSFSGKLAAGKRSDTYYLVVKMKETAGNDFQGKKYTGIGITVHAVQSNAESGE